MESQMMSQMDADSFGYRTMVNILDFFYRSIIVKTTCSVSVLMLRSKKGEMSLLSQGIGITEI
jgi:hypothetical protein